MFFWYEGGIRGGEEVALWSKSAREMVETQISDSLVFIDAKKSFKKICHEESNETDFIMYLVLAKTL